MIQNIQGQRPRSSDIVAAQMRPVDDSERGDSLVPRPSRRRTSHEISLPHAVEASPSKEQLKQENQSYRLTLESIEQETCTYARAQRSEFQGAAQRYHAMTRELMQSEVAQTEAVASQHYLANMQLLEKASSAEMGTQKFQFMELAEQAMTAQRSQIVEEAKAYLQHQDRMAKASFQDQQEQTMQQLKVYMIDNQEKQNELSSMWNELNQASQQMQASSSQTCTLQYERDRAIESGKTFIDKYENEVRAHREIRSELHESQQDFTDLQDQLGELQNRYAALLDNIPEYDIYSLTKRSL